MSILIPLADETITLQEIPDKISYAIEIGNCMQGCKGCHSGYLQKASCPYTTLKNLLDKAEEAVKEGANAILLMGGTTNEIPLDDLITVINALADIAPVCVYSGSDDDDIHDTLCRKSALTWLKTGSYKQELGGLDSPTTNQRFYRKEYVYKYNSKGLIKCIPFLYDCTFKFQK